MEAIVRSDPDDSRALREIVAPAGEMSLLDTHPADIWDSTKSHFAVLGLEPGASSAAVKRAYRAAVLKYHPDKVQQGNGPEGMSSEVAANHFRAVQEAFEVLKEDGPRAQHERDVKRRGAQPRAAPRRPPQQPWSQRPKPAAPKPRTAARPQATKPKTTRPAQPDPEPEWQTWWDIFGTLHYAPGANYEGGYWDTQQDWHREWYTSAGTIEGGWTDSKEVWHDEWWTYGDTGAGLRAGAGVALQGLSGAQELNGLTGILRSRDAASGRWNVELRSGAWSAGPGGTWSAGPGGRAVFKAIKPENLRVVVAWHSQFSWKGWVYWESIYADGRAEDGSYQEKSTPQQKQKPGPRYSAGADAEYRRAQESVRQRREGRALRLNVGDTVMFYEDGKQVFGTVLSIAPVRVRAPGNRVVTVLAKDLKKI